MNRSFRAQESPMQAALKERQQKMGGLRSSMMKEKDDELALFLEMKKREWERSDLLLHSSEELDAPLSSIGSNPGASPIFNISASTPDPARKTGADDFLNSENDKNDYDWLLTPPETPLFPSLDMESRKTVLSQLGPPTTRPTSLKSRSANLTSKQPAVSPGLSSSSSGTRRPSSSGGPGSRPATPTGRPRPTLTSTSKSSRPSTPTSRATLSLTRSAILTSKPTVSATKAAVSTSKTNVPAAKSATPSRSSTPLSRSTARSSTPTSRPTLAPSWPTSRASTPTRRPSTPSNASTGPSLKTTSTCKSAPVTSRQPTSVTSRQSTPVKSRQPVSTTSKPSVASHGASPTAARPRPWIFKA